MEVRFDGKRALVTGAGKGMCANPAGIRECTLTMAGVGGITNSGGGSLNSTTLLWEGSPNSTYPLLGGSQNPISRVLKIDI